MTSAGATGSLLDGDDDEEEEDEEDDRDLEEDEEFLDDGDEEYDDEDDLGPEDDRAGERRGLASGTLMLDGDEDGASDGEIGIVRDEEDLLEGFRKDGFGGEQVAEEDEDGQLGEEIKRVEGGAEHEILDRPERARSAERVKSLRVDLC